MEKRTLFHNEQEEACFIKSLSLDNEGKEQVVACIRYLARLGKPGNEDSLKIIIEDREDTVEELTPLLQTDSPDLKASLFFLAGGLMVSGGHYRAAFNKLWYGLTLPGVSRELSAFIIFRLAVLNFRQNRFQEAVDIYFRLLDICSGLETLFDLRPLVQYEQANVFIIMQDHQSAGRLIEELEAASHPIADTGALLILKGALSRSLKQYEEALGFFERAAGMTKDPLLLTDLYYQSAHCRLGLGDCPAADECLSRGRRFLAGLETQSARYQGRYENLAGLIEMNRPQPDYRKSASLFFRSAGFFKPENDQRNLARVKRNLGRVYFRQNRYHRAVNYLDQALGHDRAIDFQPGAGRTLLLKASVSVELGQYRQVREYLKEIRSLSLPQDHQLYTDISRIEQTIKKGLADTEPDTYFADRLDSLSRRVGQLEKGGAPAQREAGRIDRQEALEAIFSYIQQQDKPVSRRKIKDALPGYSRSVNKWLNILMDDFGVIEASGANQQNRAYRVVSSLTLKKLAKAGKIVQGETGYRLILKP
ncbi:MAG: tetratricopeptide repeat protein [bacterium]